MGKLIDLTNQRFGFWIVLRQGGRSLSGQTKWICRCECGEEGEITSNSLRTGNSTSCGCNHNPDLVGEKFNQLTVLGLDSNKNGVRKWLCSCNCGNEIVVNTYKLRQNIITSCGCDALLNQAQACVNLTLTAKNENKRLTKKTMVLLETQARLIKELSVELQKSAALLSKSRR
jgi:hypothetical protein